MTPLAEIPAARLRAVRFVLCDIDDTLTGGGRLEAAAYAALEALSRRGYRVVPVTGRPAGWCDLIARFWPVAAVVGENGAFYFAYDHARRVMTREYWQPPAERAAARARLDALAQAILAAVPGAALAADQPYRESDLAIDHSEDVAPLSAASVARIVELMREAGASAKISSIHVNGWFGDWDKLAMTRRLFRDHFDGALDAMRDQVAFIGDSPNDEPMFAYFPTSVGVANIGAYRDRMTAFPAFVTEADGGAGFVEFATALLA